MENEAFIIDNITDFGNLMAFCIDQDITVWRTYFNEREKNNRCYSIDWKEKRCYYARKEYWLDKGYKVYKPTFYVDEWGKIEIKNNK